MDARCYAVSQALDGVGGDDGAIVRQRTVYRLTLVKAWNVDELKAYAELIALGRPDFVEVKGVTYCGESSASSLTMANVPWHPEVVTFAQQLADLLPDYAVVLN
ncbi:hypothetical protein CRUP_033818 [Coryphaenoides rupestris]|nr:hypothetical protein CRUP_033818 [Coryphaenoides rupestris]